MFVIMVYDVEEKRVGKALNFPENIFAGMKFYSERINERKQFM
ncbi:hypothetical protein [Thermosyntropha sp.]|nr:hypothetical protein [Thermosyntropha sp.]